MGAQDEYLRNFTVLLTEKGVVPLTDPMQIAVYNELCSGSKRPSDIAASLGIPSSSLHFVLDKMTDSGVIVRSKPFPDKKSVYYSNLAQKIAGSGTPREGAADECREVFLDPSRHSSGLASVASMLDAYTAEIGLEIDQLRLRYARDLADAVKADIGSGSLEDSIVSIKERFSAITGHRFSVFALNPLTIVFEGDRTMASQMDMLSMFAVRAVENATGRTYAAVSTEDFCSGDQARFKITFDRVEKGPEPYINMSLPQSGEVIRFLMVDLDGSVGLITSPVQIDIVDAVYERPLCITDIVAKVEAPRSTVTSNLLRMVEEGVISVFYSESGAAYYGMSCSILMKKSRGINRDGTETRSVLASTAGKKGSFMEGYLLYLLSTLKGLGFDTDYMMVVLGAKYMRTAGSDGPRNFDVFFGKMSDIAQTIGLSLNVVSVYPLTIGISSKDPDSVMSPAMTFVKGMAHQGLEMASNGIFVRVSDDTPADRKVSFKEIYPALSMTPAEGTKVETLADAAPVKKKRTSSVKTALLNRSTRENGRPMRTVRYITGMALLVFVTAVLMFGFTGGDDHGAEADTVSIGLTSDCEGITFYDPSGAVMDMPIVVSESETISFSVSYSSDASCIGVVKNGVAYPLDRILPSTDGLYTMTVSDDLTFEPIEYMDVPEDDGLTFTVYSFNSAVSESYADAFDGFLTIDAYVAASGGLWVTEDTVFKVQASEGCYIDTGHVQDPFLYTSLYCIPGEVEDLSSAEMPSDSVEIHLNGSYEADGRFVTGILYVRSDSDVSLRFISTNGPVSISMVTLDGIETALALQPLDRTVSFHVDDQDVVVTYRHTGIF